MLYMVYGTSTVCKTDSKGGGKDAHKVNKRNIEIGETQEIA